MSIKYGVKYILFKWTRFKMMSWAYYLDRNNLQPHNIMSGEHMEVLKKTRRGRPR